MSSEAKPELKQNLVLKFYDFMGVSLAYMPCVCLVTTEARRIFEPL